MLSQKKFRLPSGWTVLQIGIVFVLSFLFSLSVRSQILLENHSYTDSSVFQYVARVILNGGMPYLDTFDHKGPFLYLLNALGLLISPRFGIWIIELATIFAAFFLMYKLACLFCRKITALFVLLSVAAYLLDYLEGGNLVEEYALPFIAGALYIFCDYFKNGKITRLRLFLCGACFGAVVLLRINMIAVWLVMCLGVLAQSLFRRDFKKLGFFLLYFLLGFFAFCGPIIIWLAAGGALPAFFRDYFAFNMLYSANSTSIYSKFYAFWSVLNAPSNLIAFFVLAVVCLKKKDLPSVLLLLCFFVSILSLSISGHVFKHYRMVLIPVLVIPFACIGKVGEDGFDKNQFAGLLVILYMLVQIVFPSWFSIVEHSMVSIQQRGSSTVDAPIQSISTWIRENTAPEDPIIVCGNWNVIYNMSGRFSASRYSYQTPIGSVDPEIQETFFREIAENKPKVIVLLSSFFAYDKMLDFINEYGYTSIPLSDSVYVLPQT